MVNAVEKIATQTETAIISAERSVTIQDRVGENAATSGVSENTIVRLSVSRRCVRSSMMESAVNTNVIQIVASTAVKRSVGISILRQSDAVGTSATQRDTVRRCVRIKEPAQLKMASVARRSVKEMIATTHVPRSAQGMRPTRGNTAAHATATSGERTVQ